VRAVLVLLVALPRVAIADDAETAKKENQGIDDTVDAAEADDGQLPSKKTNWNEFDLKLLTMRVGGGVLLDWVTYQQDPASHEQMPVEADEKLRDFRVLLKGRFAFSKRLSYTLGYMYDAPTQTWRFRQTGIMVDAPELGGNLFIGRTKEGFSTNKLMVGYFGWTMERSAANEAFLPILADGIKWTGQGFDNHLVYNAGWFIDTLSENESFNKNDKQFAGRVVYLPLAGTSSVLHLAFATRFADSNDGMLQYKSRPEAFPAQSFAVDTGMFPAASSTTLGFEAYYRPGPLMFGSEYYLNMVASADTRDPFFHGGEAFVAYMLTGEEHPYNERGAYFEGVQPEHTVDKGGLGAWEVLVRGSYVDLDSGTIEGGRFWRITPMINWYASDNLRLELEYGYSELARFGVTEPTQYFQARLQLIVM